MDLTNLPEEEWRNVNNHYAVSNKGRVKRLFHHRVFNGIKHTYVEKMLNPLMDKKGYLRVSIDQKSTAIHRLIAQAFIDNPEKLNYVTHKNNIRTDNLLENLKWCGESEASKKSYLLGRKMAQELVDFNEEEKRSVIQLTKDGKFIKKWDYMMEPMKTNPVLHSQNIRKVCKHERHTCGGYVWRYVEEYYAAI